MPKTLPENAPCPCGKALTYDACCASLHQGAAATTAELLMRSRYSAYVLKLEDYLLATWHPDTRPRQLDLAADASTWLGLAVRRHEVQDASHASVEFVARYRVAGRGHRLHEISRFVHADGRWLYVDGEVRDGRTAA